MFSGQFAMLAVSMGSWRSLLRSFCVRESFRLWSSFFWAWEPLPSSLCWGAFGFLISCSNGEKSCALCFSQGLTGLSFVLYLLGNLGGILELPGNLTVFSVLRPETVWHRKWSSGNWQLSSAFGASSLWFCFSDFSKKIYSLEEKELVEWENHYILRRNPAWPRNFTLHVNSVRKDGYLESEDSVVTGCVGHLVTMSYPEVYDENTSAGVSRPCLYPEKFTLWAFRR